jgi:RHS repeat-associated protein
MGILDCQGFLFKVHQGNRTHMIDPFGTVTLYGYDAQNRLERVGTTVGQWDAVYTYRKNSQPSGITRLNGVQTTWAYDTLKTTLTHNRAGQGNKVYQNQSDIKGNITGRTENGQTQSFTYDKLNRIQSTSEYAETYTYDTRGNRLTLLSGKPLSIKEQSNQYDRKNRLTQVTGENGAPVSYRYNGDCLLTERTEGAQSTRYYYDEKANIIAEGIVNGGNVTHKASYIRGNQLEVQVDAAGSKGYYILNGHGDVVELADGAGQTKNTYTYDMWGAPLTTNEFIAKPFRYSGELWDSTTGLQYLRARLYDPHVRRFMNEELEDPLSLNLYTYVKNNPLRYWDPTGHRLIEDSGGLGGLPSPFGGYAGTVPKTVTRGTTPNKISIKSPQTQQGGAGKVTESSAASGRDIVGTDYSDVRPTQSNVNRAKVDEYKQKLINGEEVVYDVAGKGRFIEEGHHRFIASQETGISVKVTVKKGSGPSGLPNWSEVHWMIFNNEDQFWGTRLERRAYENN